MDKYTEQTLSSQLAYHGRIFDVLKDEVMLADGLKRPRDVIVHPGGVVIAAIDGDDILLVRQYRYPVKQTELELPAGRLEIGEDPFSAAKRELLEETGYPGMKILEFAFDSSHDSLYLPHKYNRNCVVYTGTHDNDTVVGWLESVGWEERKFICDYVGHYNIANEYLAFEIVRLAMGSIADLCIIPIQDYLSLGKWARTNTPGTVENNWRWRVSKEAMTEDLAAKIEWLTDLFGRKIKAADKEEKTEEITEENKDKKTTVLAD